MGRCRVCLLVPLLVSQTFRPGSSHANYPFFSSVESKGRTLEELEWVYSQPHPVKASLVVDKIVVQEDGTVTEKIQA